MLRVLRIPIFAAWTLLFALAGDAPVFAADGVLEINQTCATQTGCLDSDPPGFPVTIKSQDLITGRSFRLTSDLTIPDANTHGIRVEASDVSIDLNGFAIRGPVICEGSRAAITCSPSGGTGSGIADFSSTAPMGSLQVRNGTISGMGANGIFALRGALVRDLHIQSNGGNGIQVFEGRGMVTGSLVELNGLSGIIVAGTALITGNTVYNNKSSGIAVSWEGRVTGNTISYNGQAGVSTSYGGCQIQDNSIAVNQGYGLSLSSTDSYQGNTITSNTGGTVLGGRNAGGNVCNGSLTCP
jgi:parallel beta-helix repeat protein